MDSATLGVILAGIAGILTAIAELRGRSLRDELFGEICDLRERVARLEGRHG